MYLIYKHAYKWKLANIKYMHPLQPQHFFLLFCLIGIIIHNTEDYFSDMIKDDFSRGSLGDGNCSFGVLEPDRVNHFPDKFRFVEVLVRRGSTLSVVASLAVIPTYCNILHVVVAAVLLPVLGDLHGLQRPRVEVDLISTWNLALEQPDVIEESLLVVKFAV